MCEVNQPSSPSNHNTIIICNPVSSHRFTNPALTGLVAVTRSSDAGINPGQASDLVGRVNVKSGTHAGQGLSWWQVDLGPTRRVAPTKYTLKHGHSIGSSRLRDWVLEGSLDGQAPWTRLRTHDSDQSLPTSCSYCTASWDMDADYAGGPTPARFLKVRMTGQNSDGSNALYLCGLEVYGALQIVGSAAQLRAEGKTAAEVKALGGYLPGELKAAGFTAAGMCAAEFTRSDLSWSRSIYEQTCC